MKNHSAARLIALATLLLTLRPAYAQTNPQPLPETTTPMTNHATGTFEVKVTPQSDEKSDAGLGRMSLEKQIHGDLEGTSKGQMLTAGTDVKGSAGYVAIERITGTLKGRSGSFVLQHSGTMTRGTPSLTITVVPDSGTGQLAGISGTMKITIADGKHSYDFDYSLP
jgi:hypothetical protein